MSSRFGVCVPAALAASIAAIFAFVSIAHACSWSAPVWGLRDKTADSLFRFIQNGKVGFIDVSGKVVLRPTIPLADNSWSEFHEGLLALKDKDGYRFIDGFGKQVFRLNGWLVLDFSEGLAPASIASQSWGFIDRTGRFAIPPQFWSVDRFSDGLARVSASGEVNSTGYIDKQGRFVVPPRLSYGSAFHDGLAAVIIDGPCRITNGGSCARSEFAPVGVAANYDCRYAYIDKNGTPISDLRFDDAQDFSEGLAAVRIGSEWGYIDKSGRLLISPMYTWAQQFSEGLAAVGLEGKTGFIDHSGRIVIPPQYLSAESFSDGRALIVAATDSKGMPSYRFIDKTGKPAFPGSFTLAAGFTSGLAPVALSSGRLAWINTSGKTVFTYDPK